MRLNLSDPTPAESRQRRGLVLADHGSAVERAAAPAKPTTSATTGAATPRYNNADFYDLFGPTKTGRKGYDVGVGRSHDAHLRRAAAA